MEIFRIIRAAAVAAYIVVVVGMTTLKMSVKDMTRDEVHTLVKFPLLRSETNTTFRGEFTPSGNLPFSKAIGKSGNETCPSHYKNAFNDNEFSPVVFSGHNLTVCRTAKTGSQEVRAVSSAYESDVTFLEKVDPRSFNQSILASIDDSTLFNQYLYGDQFTRIMFVRHPVLRILSGFLQIANKFEFWDAHDMQRHDKSPASFHKWVLNETLFFRYYRTQCDSRSKDTDLHPKLQHYAPPQYCRCGISDCGVQWNFYRLEDQPIRSVLSKYLPEKYLKPESDTEIMHKREYSKRDYLTDEVLSFLNTATKQEQDFFGYKPLTGI